MFYREQSSRARDPRVTHLNKKYKVGLLLPNRLPLSESGGSPLLQTALSDHLLSLCELAETSGFDSIWLGDSLYKLPRLDSVTMLSAIAARTKRVKLGTACMASFALRNPFTLAYQWSTLDVLSGGRTILVPCAGAPSIKGVEKGGQRFYKEWEIMGKDYKHRGEMMEEYIEVIRKLWTEDHVTFAGKYVNLTDVTLEPKPFQRPPPIWIANNIDMKNTKPELIERVFRRVARIADGWFTGDLDSFITGTNLLRKYLQEYGRSETALEKGYQVGVSCGRNSERAFANAKSFLDAYYLTDNSADYIKEHYVVGSYGECAQRIQEIADMGITTLVIRPLSNNPMDQTNEIQDNLFPLL